MKSICRYFCWIRSRLRRQICEHSELGVSCRHSRPWISSQVQWTTNDLSTSSYYLHFFMLISFSWWRFGFESRYLAGDLTLKRWNSLKSLFLLGVRQHEQEYMNGKNLVWPGNMVAVFHDAMADIFWPKWGKISDVLVSIMTSLLIDNDKKILTNVVHGQSQCWFVMSFGTIFLSNHCQFSRNGICLEFPYFCWCCPTTNK